MCSLRKRILYVEDDKDTRELVTVMLELEECEVLATASQEDALRLALNEHFDLYLIDNWMPGVSGVGLCEQLRNFDSDTPILFYSGAAQKKDIERALSRGAQGYLIKPTGLDELAPEIFRLISNSHNKAS